MPSHRLLAVLRGENESVLRVKVEPNSDAPIDHASSVFREGQK